jgi:hypothetical protein
VCRAYCACLWLSTCREYEHDNDPIEYVPLLRFLRHWSDQACSVALMITHPAGSSPVALARVVAK